MIYQEIIGYYKQETAKGIPKDQIIDSLLNAGWQMVDIKESLFSSESLQTDSPPPPIVQTNPSEITEVNYPIEAIWILKSAARYILGILVFFFYFIIGDRSTEIVFYLIFMIIFMIFSLVFYSLRRKNFHYSTDLQFFSIKQGIISKQQRNIPYGVIQNVFIKRDIFDRIFGLASLTIENASQAGGHKGQTGKIFGLSETNSRQQVELLGFKGNKVSIPGLTEKNSNILKNIILQKMKENPLRESYSGL